MYKPSKRLMAQGTIPERGPYFNEFGYEYTFYMNDHNDLVQPLKAWLETQNKRMFGSRFYEDRPVIVIGVPGCQLEVYRTGKKEVDFPNGTKGNAVTYCAFFSRWENYGNILSMGDEMNMILTAVETTLVGIDPLTWIRELPLERHVTNGIMSRPEKWEAKQPDTGLTREAAAEKKLSEGFLADRLNAAGLQVNGGSPMAAAYQVPVNPMIPERVQRNLEKAEAAKNAPPVQEEPIQKEKIIKEYPPMFLVETGEPLDPFIHACIDENKNIIREPQDHVFIEVPLAGIAIYSRPKDAKNYSQVYRSNVNRDNFLYVSDSRIALINRKYNKNEAGGWIGFGSLTAYAVSSLLNGAEKAFKAAQRREKALAGHIRYEWIGIVGYRYKQKMLEDNTVRVVYRDRNDTLWNVELALTKDTDAAALANDLVRRIAVYRSRMTDKKGEKAMQFCRTYAGGMAGIVPEQNPSKISSLVIPEICYAGTGAEYRPAD